MYIRPPEICIKFCINFCIFGPICLVAAAAVRAAMHCTIPGRGPTWGMMRARVYSTVWGGVPCRYWRPFPGAKIWKVVVTAQVLGVFPGFLHRPEGTAMGCTWSQQPHQPHRDSRWGYISVVCVDSVGGSGVMFGRGLVGDPPPDPPKFVFILYYRNNNTPACLFGLVCLHRLQAKGFSFKRLLLAFWQNQ